MSGDRWRYTSHYLTEVFGHQDEHLAGLMADAVRAGLPDIAVSADVGRLLALLTRTTGARRALEIGTLGGYSAIWIARALASDGKLTTIEAVAAHAEFAQAQFERAGVSDRIDVVQGSALEVLPRLADVFGPESIDFVFIDADKREYPSYWNAVRRLVAPSGIVVVDNVLGAGSWWIDDEANDHRAGVDTLNRMVAADPQFESVAFPLRQGVLLARRL
ncbi:MAG: O-methyltransferase [Deltaproteobacteria bacterium]|nr:O-methyltransferase [Deltaproteobacteria bacterium]